MIVSSPAGCLWRTDPGKVPHRLQRKEVAARGCHCNEVPAGLLGIPLPRRILGLGADGTTVAVRREGELPRVVLGKDVPV